MLSSGGEESFNDRINISEIIFISYSCSQTATMTSTDPTTSRHAGQHWYNRTQSKYIQPSI